MQRVLVAFALLGLAAVTLSCGGSSSLNDDEATVYLTANIDLYNPDIDICTMAGADVTVENMTIQSILKDPTGSPAPAQDVVLRNWVVTPYRTDGGATASPAWQYAVDVYVPAGGNADLANYRVLPAEYFTQPPLNYLLPENGGFDPETGNRNIRESVKVEIFGRTNGGKAVSVVFHLAFNFTCAS